MGPVVVYLCRSGIGSRTDREIPNIQECFLGLD